MYLYETCLLVFDETSFCFKGLITAHVFASSNCCWFWRNYDWNESYLLMQPTLMRKILYRYSCIAGRNELL